MFISKKAIAFFSFLFILFINSVQGQSFTDRDIKKNLSIVANPLSYLSNLQPFRFEYDKVRFREFSLPDGEHFGFIAEDVEKVFPEMVKNESRFYTAGKNAFKTLTVKTVDYEKLIPVLVGAVREQQAEIDKLRRELQELKTKR